MRAHFRSAVMAIAVAGGTFIAPGVLPATLLAQAQAKAPSASGTVKALTPNDMVVTTAAGQDVAVTVGASAKILIVPPGSTNLSAATPGTMADIQGGDRAIVTGTAGDTMPSLNATRVILMKSNAIAARNAASEQAWAQGVGGIVKSVSGTSVVISSGLKTITVSTTPQTIVRRYAPGSVRFEDAVKSDAASIQPGDQLRVRGSKNEDGTAITADEIVAGSFTNLSGVLTAVDASAGTVTFKDLKTKKVVTVAVTDKSDVRRLPPEMAARMAGGGAGAGRRNAGGNAGGPPAGGPPAGGGENAPAGEGGGGRAGGGYGGRRGGAGADLSRMLSRMPTETLSGLKKGDAVMVVATSDAHAGSPVAVTLLTGVDTILAASPQGETELSPWSLGGGGGGGGEGEGGGH